MLSCRQVIRPTRGSAPSKPSVAVPLAVPLVVPLVLALALVLALVVSWRPAPARAADGQHHRTCSLGPRLVPLCRGRVLTGAYVAPAPGESYSSAVGRFERQSGARAQIVHFYYRGDRRFPNADEAAALTAGRDRRILFASWKPDDGYTWRQVADGAADAMLERQAAYLKKTWTKPMLLTIHHEPENEVQDAAGSGYRAVDYAAMFRHVEQVFDRAGVTNVRWVMNYMGFERWALTDWWDDLYPGDRYVDWLAFDPYKTPRLGGQEGGFPSLVNQYYGGSDWRGFYAWAQAEHPGHPIMMAEWGIAERPGDATWKGRFFSRVARHLRSYPHLRALVYNDNPDADVAGNVSIDTSSTSLAGFRTFMDSGRVASIG